MSTREQLSSGAPKDAPVNEVVEALDSLLQRDGYLLTVDASERSIAHRLAIYLDRVFPNWNVDCEYNRDGHEPKRMNLKWSAPLEPDDEELRGSLVLPDIIIHRRRETNNLLVIEMKKSSNRDDDDADRKKLEAYLRILHYRYALFLRWRVGENPGLERVEWIQRRS